MPARPFRRRRGFTLVELLVVFAALAILSAVLGGVALDARAKARQTACASNLRQLGQALHLYAQDHDGWLPETSHYLGPDRRRQAWVFTLAPYLENVDQVRLCPADPRLDERRAAGGSSYVLNSFVFNPARDPFGRARGVNYRKLDRIPRPPRTLFAFNIADTVGPDPGNDHTHSDQWVNWNAVLHDIQPDRHGGGAPSPAHDRGVANYLFADTHVEAWDAAEVRRRIEARDNFAQPPK